MMIALKMIALRIADSGLCRCMMFIGANAGIVTMNRAGTIAKYLATSLAIEAKYFAIVPALFIASIPSLQALNIMHLDSPESAILSAVIFNAVIIPLLIPLALRGVTYKPIGASALLRRNLFIYGLGGVIVPFVGIKLIDMLVSVFF